MKTLRNALLCLTVLQLCPSFSYSSDGPVVSCCQKTSNTMLERAKIKSYYKQKKGLCPVDAVIFVTVKGKKTLL
uniref:Chemokine interleukin-8-like domain-containing protein n=1 Tax=Anguilla anguilla TaxID=7936 RepID=A0A0E9WAU8_ANGAN